MAELFNLETQNPESIILPAAEFVTDAALVRHNDDLILTLPDGREQVVEGYFAADPRPTLTLEDSNAALTPELVQSFLQEITFSGEGSATATDSQGNAIGNVETVIGEVTAVRNGAKITLEAGDPVFQGDIIETETAGSAKLRFIDETVFSISEDARLALDKMVFDPETAEGETILSMLKGGFLFISGQIAKTDPSDMQVVTPVATIGIRGTIVTGNVSPGESFEFSVVDGAIAVQPQGSDEPIVMDSAFATLGGSVSESGAITTRISQDSARAVIERNAGQFATLSDADVAAIETAVTATAVQNGETVTLDLQDLIEEVVTEATADDAQDDQDTVTESPVVETSPVNDTVTDDLGDDLGNETGDIDVSPVEPVTGTGDGNTEETPQDDDDDGPVTVEIPVTVPVINVLSGAISRANAILSGTAQAGTTIIVIGTLNGVEEQSFTTTTSGNGTWSVNLGADNNVNPDGETYSYSVTATDSAGTTSAPATTTVILDFVAPKDVALDSSLTDGTTLNASATTLSGTSDGASNITVKLTANNGQTVTYDNIIPDSSGNWSVDLASNADLDDSGETDYAITLTAKDAAGNETNSAGVTGLKTDFSVPAVTLNVSDDSLIGEANKTISGTVSENVPVTVKLTDSNNQTYTYTLLITNYTDNGDGTYKWSLDLSTPDDNQQTLVTDGTINYEISATAKDAAGNTTTLPATADNVTPDFVAPTVPNATLTQTLANDGTATIEVVGNAAEAGIEMLVALQNDAGDELTSSQATVDQNGDWTVTFSGLLSGTYKAAVVAQDAAENISSAVNAKDGNNEEITLTLYEEDWSGLTEGRTADYSSTHTAQGVDITTSSHADDLTTTSKDDIIRSSSGNDIINTGDGNDEISLTYENYVSGGERPTSFVDAGDGDDTVIVSDKAIDIESTGIALEGGAGTDTLVIYDEQSDDTVATTGDTKIQGFETIILVDDEYDKNATDQKQITFTDSAAGSYYLPKSSFDANGGLTLQGSMTADDIKVENGMQVVWKDANESNGVADADNGSTIDTITLSSSIASDTQLTLQANGSLTDGAKYDFEVTDSLTLEAGTTLTLQADDNSATLDQNGVPLNGMSRILKVGDGDSTDSFFMDRDATLAIDFLNLSGNDLLNASNVIDLYDDASNSNANANFAGALHIHANDAINYADGTGSQTMIRTYGSSYSTFDEILFLGADGSNLVGAEDDGTVSSGTDNALVAIYTDNNGIQLKAVTANEVNEATFDAADDGAYFSTTETTVSATATTSNTDGVAFYGSNNHADTFEISSAKQIAYFDGGSGDHNDTLKITDNAVQFSDIYDSSNTDAIMDFQVNRIETLDISGNDAYETTQLDLSVEMVRALTEDTNVALGGVENALIVKVGNGNIDKINVSSWGNSTDVDVNGTTYSVYETTDTDGNVARLYVDKSGQ